MKKGITVISLSVVILLLAIVTSTVIYTNNDALKITNKTKYAMEFLDVQTKVDNYYLENGKYPSVAEVSFDVSKFKEEEKIQISGETVTSNKIKLYSIDLNLLGIKNSLLGNNKSSTDIYAVSEITGKVYYLKGFSYKKVRYYTLTDELYNGLGTTILNKNYKEVRKEEVIFRVSELEDTNQAVTVDVMIPVAATGITVTTTNSVPVASFVVDGEYKKYVINGTKLVNNYDITVKYILNGKEKTITYSVNNVDIIGPVISISTEANTGYTKLIVTATDANNEVVKIKCDIGNLTKEYFANYGKTLIGNTINCYETGTYTVYAEDSLGNSTLYTKSITVN
ncbi:MAG: hypothetical protein IKL68_00700 [Clostridia bacterium]|nr:hypothetical protein [Clostridia bacterium]